jgi:hypothetical protein
LRGRTMIASSPMPVLKYLQRQGRGGSVAVQISARPHLI